MSSSDSPPSWLGSPASCSSPVQVVRGGIFHSHFLKRISSEDASELQCNSDQHNSCDLCETNDCLECNEWIPPNSDTIQKIITQVEFYLSDENLAVDSFLLKHMKRNKTGYISIKLLTSFKKVKCLTKDWKATAYALNYSKLLEINPEGTKIRRKIPVPDFLLSVPPSKRILAWNLNKYFPEKNNEMWGRINIMETAMKIFAIYGPISSIRILQPESRTIFVAISVPGDDSIGLGKENVFPIFPVQWKMKLYWIWLWKMKWRKWNMLHLL
ncbi:la-related protein 6-like isoform X3 [Chiloscyllium plagiosum]|uniref:la-related protein 6-like isoform X3 n=1 Tax=Chiloscyllium plagiosum TaxID=36176 RepID=UPI001CB83FF1|nr:la-related protein 6-like isoform X3 [Chiloscyllium plagiosum]